MQQEPQEEPQQVTTKNPKKVETGKRLAAHNRRKREEKEAQSKAQALSRVNQYHGIGAVIAVGVIGGLGYYIYQAKKGAASGEVNTIPNSPTPRYPRNQPSPRPQTNKFEMD